MMTVDLSYTEFGPNEGPAIVILHGLFGSKRNWGAVAKALSARHRVFTLDLRNHGDSPWIDSMTYEALAADVSQFIYHHGLELCTVIGHSMGGKTAMMLALRKPELVSRLVVVDIAPVQRETDIGAYIKVMANVPLKTCSSRQDVEDHLSHAVTNVGIRQFLLQNLVREDHKFHWRINLSALDAGMGDIADFKALPHEVNYPGPTQFIAGGKSDYILPHHKSTIETLFPKANIATIKGASHWVHAEAYDEFMLALNAFLEST